MNCVETIAAVRAAGGTVTVRDGSLVVDAPPDLPSAVWQGLATHKQTLIDLMAPSVTYATLAAHEEREAMQAAPPAGPVTFERPRPARRCRLIRDTAWECPTLGRVTFPAGIEGTILDDPREIDDPYTRLVLAWAMRADHADGRDRTPVLIDGRVRLLATASIIIEGDQR